MPAAAARPAQPPLHQPGNPVPDHLPGLADPLECGPLSTIPSRPPEGILRLAQDHPSPAGTGGALVAAQMQRATAHTALGKT